MKRILLSFVFALAALAALPSCGLNYEALYLQTLKPSVSGVDLRQKSIAAFVLYVNAGDSLVCSSAVTRAMENLADEYSLEIPLFALPLEGGKDYSDKNVLASLVTESNADFVIVSVPDPAPQEGGLYSFSVYGYDSLSQSDEVVALKDITASASDFESAVQRLHLYFRPSTVSSTFHVLFFDSSKVWSEALTLAEIGRWTDAVGKWMDILEKSDNLEWRMAAEYNIALGCYLLGDCHLAGRWIEQAFKDGVNVQKPYCMDTLRSKISLELK